MTNDREYRYKLACQSMRASMPGFPYMLDEEEQCIESELLTECAVQTDSENDWMIVAIDDGQSEFAGAWEHSGRP